MRPLEESDLPQVETWLRTEHVAHWWRDPLEIAVEKRPAAEFARSIVFARPETSAVVATVEEANGRSWRAFEKAGFLHVRVVEEDGLPHRLTRLDRRYAQ